MEFARRKNPDIFISTGAGIAVPFFYIGKLLGKRLIFIESFTRINMPSLTGRLVYPISDLFFIQWDELKKHYPKAIFVGGLF